MNSLSLLPLQRLTKESLQKLERDWNEDANPSDPVHMQLFYNTGGESDTV